MTMILLVAAAVGVGLFVGIKRYGGWKRWTSDIRAGLRKQREAGFLATAAGYSGLLSGVGAICVWAIYTLGDVLRWSNLGQFSWGTPVWAADVAFPATAVLFTFAALSIACMILVVRRDRPNIPYAVPLIQNALWTPVFGVAAIVAMVWRINVEQLPPIWWLYLLPVLAATLASVCAFFMLLIAGQERKESAKLHDPI